MYGKRKVVAIAVIIGLVLSVLPAMAQQSSTLRATQGIITGDVDNFLSVVDYSQVEFEKSFSGVGHSGSELWLGYAGRFGGIYLGAAFSGNLFNNTKIKVDTEEKDYALNGLGQYVETEKVSTGYYQQNQTNFRNGIGLLLGVAGMGIRVGFDEDITLRDDPNRGSGNGTVTTERPGGFEQVQRDVTEYSFVNTYLTPSLTWGMTLDLGGITLKPVLHGNITLGQNEELQTLQDRSTDSNTIIDTLSGSIENYIAPSFGAGFDLALAKNGASQIGLTLNYNGGFKLYSSDYDVLGTSDTVEGRVQLGYTQGNKTVSHTVNETAQGSKTTTDTVYLTLTEKSFSSHSITPAFWYNNEITPQASFGISAGASVYFSSDKSTEMVRVNSKQVYEPFDKDPATAYTGTEIGTYTTGVVETSTVIITPEFALGGTLAAVPGTLILNAGIGIILPSYTAVNTATSPGAPAAVITKVVYDDGRITQNSVSSTENTTGVTDSQRVDVSWSSLRVSAGAGFTFNLSSGLAFDAAITTNSNVSVTLTVKK